MSFESFIAQSLSLYRLSNPMFTLIRHNENMTYKVTDGNNNFVLRIHKPTEGFTNEFLRDGQQPSDRIQSEMDIICELNANAGLPMQTPVAGINGRYVQELTDGTSVTMLEWLDGETVSDSQRTPGVMEKIGELTAKMHTHFFDGSKTMPVYARYRYDQAMLERIRHCLYKAEQGAYIARDKVNVMYAGLDEMAVRMDELDKTHRQSIVHADLSGSNMVLGMDGRLSPIDFSLCGYSHFYMDLGVLFGIFAKDEERAGILTGYRRVRNVPLEAKYIEPYFALGVVLFIAGQYERAKEWNWFPGKVEDWCRDIFTPLVKGGIIESKFDKLLNN